MCVDKVAAGNDPQLGVHAGADAAPGGRARRRPPGIDRDSGAEASPGYVEAVSAVCRAGQGRCDALNHAV